MIAYRSGQGSTAGTGTAASLNVAVPSGVQEGDLMLMAIFSTKATHYQSMVDGWAQLGYYVYPSATYCVQVCARRASASEPSYYTVAVNNNPAYVCGGIIALSGADTSGIPARGAVVVGSYVYGLAVSPDGQYVYASGTDGSIAQIQTSDLTVVNTWTPGFGSITGLVCSPDGASLWVADSANTNVWVMSTSTGSITQTITAYSGGCTDRQGGTNPLGLLMLPDGSKVFSCSYGGVSSINTSTYAPTSLTVGSRPNLMCLKPDGSRLYVCNRNDQTVSVINTSTNATITTISGFGAAMDSIVASPDGAYVYVGDTGTNSCYVIDTSNNTLSRTITLVGGYSLGVSPDSTTVYGSYGTGAVKKFTVGTWTVSSVLTMQGSSGARAMAFSPDGRYLYLGHANYPQVVRIADGVMMNRWGTGDSGNFQEFVLSPDGKTMYVGSSWRVMVLPMSAFPLAYYESSGTTPSYALIGPFPSRNGIDVCFGQMYNQVTTTAPPSGYSEAASVTAGTGTTGATFDIAYSSRLAGQTSIAAQTSAAWGVSGLYYDWHVFVEEDVSTYAHVIEYTSGGSAETDALRSTSDGTILAANSSRTGGSVFNDTPTSLYLLLANATASATNCTIKMAPGTYYELPFGYTGVVKGAWA